MNQFLSVGEVLAALRRRMLFILVVSFVGCMVSLYYALGLTKVYEATAVLQIEDAPVPEQLAGALAANSDAARRAKLIEQRMMARDNLLPLMQKYDLFREDAGLPMSVRIGLMRDSINIQQLTIQYEGFAATPVPSGLMINVRLEDPDKAAAIANDLMTSVVEQTRDRSLRRAQDTFDFFVEEEARVGTEIEALEDRIAKFKRDNADQLPSGLSDLRAQLASLRATDLDLDQRILTSETGADRIREEVLTRRIAALQEQKALIAARIAEIEARVETAPDAERELGRMEREMSKLREQYEVIARKKAEAELGQQLEDRQATERFEVLETALPPEVPVSRSRKKVAMAGGMASVAGALVLALALEMMFPVIRTPAQMERVLGVQPVVSIPVVRSRGGRGFGGIGFFARAVALLAIIGLGLRLIWDRAPGLADMLGRFVPRLAGN